MTSASIPIAPAQPVDVLIVDDHPAVQGYLTQMLEHTKRYRVVGQTETAQEAIALARKLKPALVILDIALLDSDDLSCLRRLRAELPRSRILIFTGRIERNLVADMLVGGANGIVSKTARGRELLDAIDRVNQGEVVLCPASSEAIRHQIVSRPSPAETAKPELTERELTVLQHIASGLNSRQIAAKMGVSPNTVISFRGRLLKKMGEHNATRLILRATQLGLVRLPEAPGPRPD